MNGSEPLNLLLAGDEVGPLLTEALDQQDPVDAYLLACAASQLAEDFLEGEGTLVQRAAKHLGGNSVTARYRGRLGALVLLVAAAAMSWARRRLPRGRRADAVVSASARIADVLADAVLGGAGGAGRPDWSSLRTEAERLVVAIAPLPLGAQLVRLPSCFRSFDQRPQDIVTLVEDSLATPARASTIAAADSSAATGSSHVVIGLRTSGSYLAPLTVAALRRCGLDHVVCMTLRPDVLPHPAVRRRIKDLRSATFVVVDDPPTSGASIRRVVDTLVAKGIPAEAISVLVAVTDDLPPALATSPARVITLPWDRWAVHQQLDTPAVAKALGRLLGPSGSVLEVVPEEPLPPARRGHVRRRFTLTVAGTDGTSVARPIAVEGAGLGYLGRHAEAVARRLGPLVPAVIGFEDGLLYRDWLAEEDRLDGCDPRNATAIARHVARRATFLAVDTDRPALLRGRQAVWEVAAEAVSGVLGRFALPLRPVVIHRIVRRALETEHPAVVDGWTGPGSWFAGPGGTARKVAFAEGAFSHHDLWCADPIYDLAALVADIDATSDTATPEGARAYRTAAEALEPRTALGTPGSERWLLYELVRIWDRRRLGYLTGPEAGRARSRAAQRFFATTFLAPTHRAGPHGAEATGDPRGRHVAIDVDGVLECTPLGFAAPSRASALALRALLAHGMRPLLVTGRSTSEVAERISAYGLFGGVAEYGAVVLDASGAIVAELVGDDERDALARLRRLVSMQPGVVLDPSYRRVVRLWQRDQRGRRRAPDVRTVRELLVALGPGAPVQVVPGEEQVDVVPARVGKQRGLETLLAHLVRGDRGAGAPKADRADGAGTATTVDFAIGDGPADLPMLRAATHAFAPANAAPELRVEGVTVTDAAYQAGLFEAVGRYLGHRPGRCERCRPPKLSPAANEVARLLSLQEAGPGPAMWRAAALVAGLGTRP